MTDRFCSKCTKKKSCGNRHVYVIELNKEVIRKPNFCPDIVRSSLTDKSKYFYVGETAHRPDCRYKQHVANRAGIRKYFICNCFENNIKREFNTGNRGSKWVKDYHKKGGLRPEHFKSLNPICGNQEDSKKVESELAKKLISMGHAAHFN